MAADEQLIVSAVGDEAHYATLWPESGLLSAEEAKAKYEQLRARLEAEPVGRWTERAFGYRIRPVLPPESSFEPLTVAEDKPRK